MANKVVELQVEHGVALVTLNDVDRRNAITLPMRDALIECFDQIERTKEIGAAVVTGAGTAFCSGAHLGDLATTSSDDLRRIYDAFLRVARSPVPTVAAVNGPAVGAGLNLALACDVRLAAKSARFVTRFLELGLHPGGGNTWMMLRAIGSQLTSAMVLFGVELDGDAASRAGLALASVKNEDLLPEAIRLARRAAEVPRELTSRVKETLRQMSAVHRADEAVDIELTAQSWSAEQPYFRERIRAVRSNAATSATASDE